MRDSTYHMSGDQQIITLVIALGAIVAIFIGFRALWLDWRTSWEIDDYINGCIAENDEVLRIEEAHPTPMPRRPKRLGRLGWGLCQK